MAVQILITSFLNFIINLLYSAGLSDLADAISSKLVMPI